MLIFFTNILSLILLKNERIRLIEKNSAPVGKPSTYIVYVLRGFYRRRRRRRYWHRTSRRGCRRCSGRRNGPCRGYRALEHDVLASTPYNLVVSAFSRVLPCNKVIKAKVGYVTLVFCCIVAWIQPDISGCQQDFLVVWRWNFRNLLHF